MNWIKKLLKPFLGIFILFLLIKFGGLDPVFLKEALRDNPSYLVWALLLYLSLVGVAGYRWYLLLNCGQIKFSFKRVFSLHMIGLFFVTLLPGGTGGDVIKGYYLYRDSGIHKGFTLSSIVMDRVVGFYALLTWGVLGIVINFKLTLNHALLKLNALFYISCYIGVTLLLVLFFLPMGERALTWVQKQKLPGHKIWAGLASAFTEFRKYPRILFKAYLLTFVVHGALLVTFYLCALSLLVDLSLGEHAFVVPILTLINGLPITPGGLGVGEAAAGTLYQMIHVNKGAEILALYHFLVLICAFLGAPFYFAYQKKANNRRLK